MLVELSRALGSTDTKGDTIFVNPRHVALLERDTSIEDGKPVFVSELTLSLGGRTTKVRVVGEPRQVKQLLNAGGR